ncbi:MAG: hypothetical protein JW944_15965 [Deltaproteobacteria bacterium]|nr:hypothetical protein [Deltaproteobacteria bacterium]
MSELKEGAKSYGAIMEGVILKNLVLRWAMVLLLACGVCMWTGCGGSDDSDDTEETDNSDDDGGDDDGGDVNKTGVYEQDGGTVTEDLKTYAATGTDESAVYVYGAGTYTLTNGTLTKTGDTSSADDSNFYGNNAIVLAEDGSTINITDCTLTSDSEGSNGAFAYEKDTVVNVRNCTISTTGNSARGVDATYGGTINIWDSEITTTGAHCSALATDRYDAASGEPEVNAYNVIAEVSGDGSVGAYSTGTFYIEDCVFTSNGSGAAVIEGTNSITLVNTDMTVTLADKYGVMVYQSMSGDALGNTGTFDMEGGSITVNGGPILLNTNDEAYFTLEDVVLSGSDVILQTGKINWGATATNGGVSHFTAINQDMTGNFVVDGYGNITAVFPNGSSLVGAIDPDNSTNQNTGSIEGGYVSLTMDATSTWTAAANSWVDELTLSTINSIDASSGVTITVDTLSGVSVTSPYTLPGGGTLVVN